MSSRPDRRQRSPRVNAWRTNQFLVFFNMLYEGWSPPVPMGAGTERRPPSSTL